MPVTVAGMARSNARSEFRKIRLVLGRMERKAGGLQRLPRAAERHAARTAAALRAARARVEVVLVL